MPLDPTLIECLSDEFKGTKKKILNCLYDLVDPDVNDSVWGVKAEEAKHLLLLHKLKLKKRKGEAGPLERQKVGQLEREFAVNRESVTSLSSTSYGLEYLRLRKQISKFQFIEC